jgi:ppGpp synthetase/RelA/SpoT-type nucleotidyltranferase
MNAEILDRFAVSEFPQLEFSKNDVKRAGKALQGKLLWTPEDEDEILNTFRVANSWLASHALPMARMRSELHGQMSALDTKGLTAARLKQMRSIRKKLRRIGSNLRQMQDLGGCRAVVPSIQDARKLVAAIKERSRHQLKREDAYMDTPRDSGYRSQHLIYAFEPREQKEDGYQGRLVELQIRSRIQHSWSTAVEAVGMFRKEALKAGEGDADWLRLFQLMSTEFAFAEGCDFAMEGQKLRVEEISDLAGNLDATQTLDAISHAVSGLEQLEKQKNFIYRFCQIIYDHDTQKVRVKYLGSPSMIGGALSEGNSTPNKNSKRFSSVVVELDSVENLKSAYPNYFGDVQYFKNNLSRILGGDPAKQFYLPPVERVPPPPKEIPDDSWLRYPGRRRWTE